jgi:hypothetical protein
VFRGAGKNPVSVRAVPPDGVRCRLVPHARRPPARRPGEPGEQMPATGIEASSVTVIEFGFSGVSVWTPAIMSFVTESDANPFGVMRQEQQEINSSFASNAYTLAQMEPVVSEPPCVPAFVMSITESPIFRLLAYRTWKASAGPAVVCADITAGTMKEAAAATRILHM